MRKNSEGFSLVELLIVVGIILILASIAVPNLIRARRSANEASAVSSMRTIGSGQLIYRHTQGAFGTLTGLGNELVIDNALATGIKSGYQFASSPGPLADIQFTVEASPEVSSGLLASGTRFFFMNEDQLVRFNLGAPATSTSGALED
jgi:prepilin-type N-terminal cleavage/methylation domain-containing protein